MYCKFCGKQIDDDVTFCPGCGKKVKDDVGSSSAEQQTTQEQTAQQQTTQQNSNNTDQGQAKPITGIGWFVEGIKNYVKFDGRATLKEFWMYYLFYFIFYIAVVALDSILLGGKQVFSSLYLIGTFLPTIAVFIRRLHDTNRSGWWYLLPIANIIFAATKGDEGPNKYGDPIIKGQ